MSTYITSIPFPWNSVCSAVLPDVIPTDEYQIELEVTDCFLNNALYEGYYLDAFHLTMENQTTTTASKIIGNGMFN